MARQALTIAGYAAGFFLPGGPAVWGAIGAAVGSYVDPQTIKGPKLGDAGMQTTAEGVYRPVVFGTAPVQGNIINRGNHQIVKHTERQGKGSSPELETEREYWTFAIRISEGEIAGVLRIKEDGKLVYDIRPESEIPDESAAYADRFTLYLGTEDQEPDPDLEAYMGTGNVSAYRGTAYIVFPNYDTTSGRRIPTFEFEVASVASPVVPSVALSLGYVDAGVTAWNGHSEDGLDWSATPTEAAHQSSDYVEHVIGLEDSFLAWAVTFALRSIDRVNWTLVWTGTGTGGTKEGAAYGDVVLLPKGLSSLIRSTDKGLTFNIVGGIASGSIAFNQEDPPKALSIGLWVAECSISTSLGASGTWVGGATHGVDLSVGQSLCGVNDIFAIGGRVGAAPAVRFTDGDSLGSLHTFPGTGWVNALCGTTFGEQEIVVAGMSNGELWWTEDRGATWVQSDETAPGEVNSIVFNGVRMIAGGSVATGGGAFIMTSENGKDWEDQDQPLVDRVLGLACLYPQPPQLAGEPVPLGGIVSALHARAGQPPSSYNTAALTDPVDGVVFAGEYTCADAVRALAGTHFFDGPEYDDGTGYRINYEKRGGAIELTLTEDDLIAIPDEQTRMDALERPRVLHLHYQSPAVGYAPAKASPQRFSPDVKVVGEVSVQTPVCFSNQDEAWQRADVMLKVAHVEVAGETKVTVPWSFLRLVPSKAIGLSLRGQTRRQRIQQMYIGEGVLDLTLVADRQSAWTSNLTGPPLPAPTPPPPTLVGVTIGAHLDIPALNDNNDRLLGYIGMTGQTEAWYGALAQRSLDAGANWTDAANTPPAAVMGVLEDDVTAASQHYTDGTNVVRVRLYRPGDELESLTQQQFLSEGGAFALSWMDGSVRRWEVMQYRDAVNEGDGVFALTTLLRGRLNTSPAAHVAGDMFVLLDGVIAVDAITAWLGQALTHRFISFGRSADGTVTTTETYTGVSQTEWPVAHVLPARLDANTISVRAVPRHRFGTEDRPVRSVNWTGYRWAVTDGSNTITRDGLADTETFDTTGWATPITITVAQLNRITGAGPAVSEDIA